MPGITAAPDKPLSRQNSAHIRVGPHALLARVGLKWHPCHFNLIWTLFCRGLERGMVKPNPGYGFSLRPYRVLEINRFRWVCGQDARRASSSRRRVEACPPKSVHFQGAEGHTMGLPFPWLLPLGKQRK